MQDEVLKKKELCKKLIKMDNEIVIVGPDCSHKNKFRIYKNGGKFGKIGDREKYKSVKSELMTKKYAKYCSNSEKLEKFIKDANTEDMIIDTFLNEAYLELAKDALKKRWEKEEKDANKEARPKERNVETKVMRKFMKANSDFITIDMEVQCPEVWFSDMTNDLEIKKIKESLKFINKKGEEKEGLTKKPRFDIISFSKDGIGIIELKVDNENTDNISSHYAHMKYILNNRDKFIQEINRRIDYLLKYDLINKNIIKEYRKEVIEQKKIWCGFLFVTGEKSKSKKIVKELENYEKINEIKFLYCESVAELDFNKWVSYKDFVSEESLLREK